MPWNSQLLWKILPLLCSPLVGATCSYPYSQEPAAFAGIEFDYLVLGGGTAGVSLSARLAEDAALTVGVIEAGDFHPKDENLDVPGHSGVGNVSYDWNFFSTPQAHATGRQISLPRGKLLGGSSGINGMAWGRATIVEYDAWKSFADDESWSWEGLLPYMKKSENVSKVPPDPYPGFSTDQAARTGDKLQHIDGLSGPLMASYNAHYFDVVPAIVQTMHAVGISTNVEPRSGNSIGVFNTLVSVDRDHGVRSYAAPTYYCSHASRRNYHVLLNAQVTKILLDNKSGNAVATGVEFISRGKIYRARVRKEVILSAGSVQTPQILELSGIGNYTLLKRHGIQTIVNLPGVGENLQEHVFVPIQWKLKPGVQTFDILRNNATVAEEQAQLYETNRTGLLADTDSTIALLRLQDFTTESRIKALLGILDQEAASIGIERKQYQLAQQWFQSGEVPFVELIQWSKGIIKPASGESYVTMLGGIVQPTSRGSVHINSSDPLSPPVIDPNFLSKEFDVGVMLETLKFMQKLGKTAPFSEFVASQTNPDPSTQSEDDLINYIRTMISGGAHLAGTAPMAPRELGGVVDGSLRVYGTSNLRVIDASIFPILLAAHTQSTVYAIAEKLAEDIKRGS